MDATNKVFRLPELLEMILLDLQPQDLIRLQRLSRSVCGTIASSSQLQRRLFYQQDPTPSIRQDQPPKVNPFIRQAVQRFAKVKIENFIHDFCEFQNCRPPTRHVGQFCVSVQVREYSEAILERLEVEWAVWPPSFRGMYLTARPCDVAIETNPWGVNDEHLPPGAKICDLVEVMRRLKREGLIGGRPWSLAYVAQ